MQDVIDVCESILGDLAPENYDSTSLIEELPNDINIYMGVTSPAYNISPWCLCVVPDVETCLMP